MFITSDGVLLSTSSILEVSRFKWLFENLSKKFLN